MKAQRKGKDAYIGNKSGVAGGVVVLRSGYPTLLPGLYTVYKILSLCCLGLEEKHKHNKS